VFEELHDPACRERLLGEAMQLDDVERREAALFELAKRLRREWLLGPALEALDAITEGYLADRIALSAKIALDLSGLGAMPAAANLLRSLDPLTERCSFPSVPDALLDLANTHKSLGNAHEAEQVLARLTDFLSVEVRREDSQLWMDTEKCKAQAVMAWALLGHMDHSEAMLERIEPQGIREHAALRLQAIRAARDLG
jgi:hypothetical protein